MKNRITSSRDAAGEAAARSTADLGHEKCTRAVAAARSLIGEALVLVVCAVFWQQTRKFEQPDAEGLGPTFLPRLLIALLVLCVAVRIVQTLWSSSPRRRTADEHPPPDEQDELAEETYPVSVRHVVQGIALAAGYALAATYLGYPLATFLLVLAFVWTASKFTWPAAGVAFLVALAFPYLFVRVVFIDLPKGRGVFYDFTIWLYGLLGIY